MLFIREKYIYKDNEISLWKLLRGDDKIRLF